MEQIERRTINIRISKSNETRRGWEIPLEIVSAGDH